MGMSVPKSKYLIVAIPAFNEERTISYVVSRLKKVLKDYNHSVLIVDDGSEDATVDVAIKAGADIVIAHQRNMGVAKAVRTAIDASLRYGAEIICLIDGDGQYNPDDVFKLVDLIEHRKADLVIGSRFQDRRNNSSVPIVNRITNGLMAMLVSVFVRQRLHDVESGFRALSNQAAKELSLMGRVSFTHDMIIDISSKGYRIAEVPVRVRYFKGRVSRAIRGFMHYGTRSLLLIAVKILLTIASYEPENNKTDFIIRHSNHPLDNE